MLGCCWPVPRRQVSAHWEQEYSIRELAETILGFFYSNWHKCALKNTEHPVILFTDQRTVSNQLYLLSAAFHVLGSISSPLPTSSCWGWVVMLRNWDVDGQEVLEWRCWGMSVILIKDNNTKWGFTPVVWHAPSCWELWRTNYLLEGSHFPIYWPHHTWITIKPPS